MGFRESKGQLGYLCLGLVYHWDDERGILVLKNMVLVKVDISLRNCTEIPLYYDMFERPVDDITEKDGKHYYEDYPILNYDMIEISNRLDGVIEEKNYFFPEKRKRFINTNGTTKYSVNRVCILQGRNFSRIYMELYACVLNFDEKTLTGDLVGFDCLGKILRRCFCLKGLTNDDDIRKELLEDMVLFDMDKDDDQKEREKECGFLNFHHYVNADEKIIYEYNSIWGSSS